MIGAILLAGGQSVRMGTDKALLDRNGQTILEHILSLVSPQVEQLVVMRAAGQAIPGKQNTDKVIWATDSIHDQGPLQGICDALELLSPNIEKILLITCDLPYLNKNGIQILLDELPEEVDLACIEDDGKKNPVLALYRKEVLEHAHVLKDNGEKRARILLKNRTIQIRKAPADNPNLFKGVNTPEEYEVYSSSCNR